MVLNFLNIDRTILMNSLKKKKPINKKIGLKRNKK